MPMPTFDELEARWQPLSQEVIRAVRDWRRQHPRATSKEIETALDEQLARLRAQTLDDTVLTSPSADLPTMNETDPDDHPVLIVFYTEHGHKLRFLSLGESAV